MKVFEHGKGKYYRKVVLTKGDEISPYLVEYYEEAEDYLKSEDFFSYKSWALELYKDIKNKIKSGLPCEVIK